MSKNNWNLFNHDYDYEEDVYDRLKNITKTQNKDQGFTNKATLRKLEFDYEEDPYEPEKNK